MSKQHCQDVLIRTADTDRLLAATTKPTLNSPIETVSSPKDIAPITGPGELNLSEFPEADFIRQVNWVCDKGCELSDLAVNVLNISAQIKRRLKFKTPGEFRTWCNTFRGGGVVDYPFPTSQDISAVGACLEHIQACETCRGQNYFGDTQYAKFMNPQY